MHSSSCIVASFAPPLIHQISPLIGTDFDSEIRLLIELLSKPDPSQFWRIHRSIVINAPETHSIEPNMAGQLVVKLKTRRELLPVSDSFMRRIRQM